MSLMLRDYGPNSGNVYRGEIYGPRKEHIADLLDVVGNPGMTAKKFEWYSRLFANSPDLYTACKWFIAQFQGDSGMGHGHWEQFPEYRAALAAIAQIESKEERSRPPADDPRQWLSLK